MNKFQEAIHNFAVFTAGISLMVIGILVPSTLLRVFETPNLLITLFFFVTSLVVGVGGLRLVLLSFE